ncbi:hypothetical protein C8Q74DRAFT_1222690 [Fomes fomentarius]|nr:hypothetical protein C8Q74DRAFT_1222690 [Fomes fomentarius]
MYSRLRVLSLSECSYEKYFDHFNDWRLASASGRGKREGVQSPRRARTVLRRVDQDLVSDASNRCRSSPVAAGARPQLVKQQKSRFRQSWAAKGKDYSFDAANDILGIVMLEIQSTEELPKLKKIGGVHMRFPVTRTGWDMDPFVVVSFGKEVFRTRVIRHSLNPQWDEKMLFHVRRYETTFKLIEDAPQKDAKTGLYPEEEDWKRSMRRCQKEDWKPEAHKGDCRLLKEGKAYEVEQRRGLHDNNSFMNGLLDSMGSSSLTDERKYMNALDRNDFFPVGYGQASPPPRARRMDHDDLDLFEGFDSDEDEDEDDEELSEDDDEPSLPKRNRRW